jgi:hypothetical protein
LLWLYPTAGIVGELRGVQQKEKVVSDLKLPTVAVPFVVTISLILFSCSFHFIIYFFVDAISIAEKPANNWAGKGCTVQGPLGCVKMQSRSKAEFFPGVDGHALGHLNTLDDHATRLRLTLQNRETSSYTGNGN